LREDIAVVNPVFCLDGVDVEACDYVDVGSLLDQGHVVPVIVKQMLFR
jgi:ethanolamine utilization protein EutA (predicted chaperonin)